MKCFAAHYCYLEQGRLCKNQVICLDESGCMLSIKPLEEETASTVFLNGLLLVAFSLPGRQNPMTLTEAQAYLKKMREEQPLAKINDILQNHQVHTSRHRRMQKAEPKKGKAGRCICA